MRELVKPRKAKYGFTLEMGGGDPFEMLKRSEKMHTLANNILKPIPQGSDTWWFETPNRMGRISINIYINDETIYSKIKAALQGNEPVV